MIESDGEIRDLESPAGCIGLVRNGELVCETEKIVADDDVRSGACGNGCAGECGKRGVPVLIGPETGVSVVVEPGGIGSGRWVADGLEVAGQR